MSGVCGFLLTSVVGYYGPLPLLGGARFTVGASASILRPAGALAALRTRERQQLHPDADDAVRCSRLFVFGFLFPYVDNVAHSAGLPAAMRRRCSSIPLTRERGDHMLIAVVCLVASLLAVVVSLVTTTL